MWEDTRELKAEDLGARIRAVRELAGAQQRDVAKSAGMSRRELQAVERGAKRLEPDELRAVAGALGVDPDVLVGFGFEGELVRAPIEERIDHVVGHDPERRKDYVTRERIEDSWRGVRGEMGEALTSCARLVSAGSSDDVRRLIDRLERDLAALKTNHVFQRSVIHHERALEQARSKRAHAPLSSVVAAGGDLR